MNRHIVLSVVFTGILLISCGCQRETGGIAAVSSSPAPAEPKPEQVKPEQPKPNEPNIQPVPVEPNKQEVVTAQVVQKPAESNIIELKPAAPEEVSPAELCKKCSDFFSRFVNKDGLVDYRSLLRKKIDLLELTDVFKTFDRKTYNSWSQDDKIAFWINAYNLQITRIILDNYPIQASRVLLLFWPPNSIRHIEGIWDQHKFIIMDEEFTLKAIEKQYFLKEFGEPRVFLAISYASLSGPPLRNEAYCGQNLNQELDDQVKKFLSGSQAFRIDRASQKVYLSSVLKPTWYGQYFVAKYGTDMKFKQQEPQVRAVLNFLTKYISESQINYLETGNYTVEYLPYDWSLNEHAGQ